MKSRVALAIALLTLFFLSLLMPLASASPDDKKSPSTSPQPVTKTRLDVKEFSGEFERWVKYRVLELAGTVTFRWSTDEQGVTSAIYEVTDTPGGFGGLMVSQTPNIITSGPAGPVPAKGKVSFFTINFASFVPSKPPKSPKRYYVRIVTRNAQNKIVGIPSAAVTIIYKDNTNQTTDFSGIPDQYKPPKPMLIETNLHSFIMNSPDEGEGEDRPYLFVAVVYLDGTTVKGWDLAHSSVRIDSSTKTHNNVLFYQSDDAPMVGKPYSIPPWTGRFQNNILPIQRLYDHPNIKNLPPELKKEVAKISWDVSLVAVIVVAMEEDATKTSAADAGRQAFVDNLGIELNAVVRGLNNMTFSEAIKLKNDPQAFAKAILDDVKGKIKDQVRAVMKKKTLEDLWLPWGPLAAINPDDYIGVDYAVISYREIYDKKTSGVPFTLNFSGAPASYTVKGRISRLCYTPYCAGYKDSL